MEDELINRMVALCRNKVREFDDTDKAAIFREVAKRLTQEADDMVLNEYFG